MATSEINFGETYGKKTPLRPEGFENWSTGDKVQWISENEGEVVPDQEETTHSKRGKWANTVLEIAEQAKQAQQAQDTIGLEAPETLESKVPSGTQQSEVVSRPVKPVLGFDVVSLSNAASPESTSLASAVRNLAGVFSSTGNNIELIREEDFTNLSEQEKIKAYDNIARAFRALVMKSQKEIKDFFQGIKIRLVEGAMNSAVYDESEKVLTIRADAEPTHIYQYITDTVIPILKEEKLLVKNSTSQEKQSFAVEEGVSQEDPILNKPPVEQQVESMEELLGSTQLDQDREGLREPKNNGIEFGRVDLSNYDPKKSTEEYDLKVEIDGALQDLEENERRILKDSNFKIITKGEEVMFPVYMEEANTLDVGFLNTGEDILNAIRNTVLPYLKDKTAVEPQVESVEESPEATQLGNVEEVVDNTEQTVQNPEKERILQELGDIRKKLADSNVSKGDFANVSIENSLLQKDYSAKKEELADLMKREILGGEVGPLTAEQQKEFNAKFNDELYQFLNSENNSYNTAIKEARGVTFMDKVKEKAREVLGTKTVQWYLSKSRLERAAMNTILFAGIISAGTFVGTGAAATALGAGAYRIARGVGSFGGATAGMAFANNRWNPETIEAWKKEEEGKIMNSEDSIEIKSQKIEELKKEVDKRMRLMALKKAGTTALFGGVGGGLLDLAYSIPGEGGVGGVKEQLGGGPKAPSGANNIEEIPEPTKPEVPGGVVKEAEQVVETPKITEIITKLFKDPSAVEQTVPKGGSLWASVRNVLENNDRFKALATPGQKDNIIAYYANKIINDAKGSKEYGFEANETYGIKLEPNQKISLGKAFSDEAEFERVLKRAENLSPRVIEQMEKKTLALENFYKANPGKVLPDEEILKIEEMPQASIAQEVSNIEKPKISGMEQEFFGPKNPNDFDVSTGSAVAAGAVVGGGLLNKALGGDDSGFIKREVLEDEIRNARGRLEQLERDSKIVEPSNRGIINPDTLRTMRGDTNNLIRNVNNGGDLSSLDTAVERAFNNDIQRAYGSEGFLGLRKVIGANTKDWGLMKGLSANEVIKYFTDDSADTKLPPNVVSELAKSAKHKEFGDQLLGLIEMTDGNVKPYENENVADFTKRLGRFVMEKHSQGVSNIKSPMKMVA